jgi:hydrogenase nickel incorporation protein HypB
MGKKSIIEVEAAVLGQNDRLAQSNREFFAQWGLLVLNLVSSPGSGKTTLLVETLGRLGQSRPCAVIEGDQETPNDAERIRAAGAPAFQINTGRGCHLDAAMVRRAAQNLPLERGGILFIENVGNLICPADFDLGEQAKVTLLSVTEGDDKPLKYPHMIAASRLMLINKIDLLPYVRFDPRLCAANARKINPRLEVLELSAYTGEGMDAWLEWLGRHPGFA